MISLFHPKRNTVIITGSIDYEIETVFVRTPVCFNTWRLFRQRQQDRARVDA
jgi:hypothetical protein